MGKCGGAKFRVAAVLLAAAMLATRVTAETTEAAPAPTGTSPPPEVAATLPPGALEQHAHDLEVLELQKKARLLPYPKDGPPKASKPAATSVAPGEAAPPGTTGKE